MDNVEAQARAERLRAALRENLKRRKAQARSRSAPSPRDRAEPDAPDAGSTVPGEPPLPTGDADD